VTDTAAKYLPPVAKKSSQTIETWTTKYLLQRLWIAPSSGYVACLLLPDRDSSAVFGRQHHSMSPSESAPTTAGFLFFRVNGSRLQQDSHRLGVPAFLDACRLQGRPRHCHPWGLEAFGPLGRAPTMTAPTTAGRKKPEGQGLPIDQICL
jgi:hypothetical protein